MSTSEIMSFNPANIDATIHKRPTRTKRHPASRSKIRQAEVPRLYGYFVTTPSIFRAAQRDGTAVNDDPLDTFVDWRRRLSAITGLPNNSRQFFPIDTPEVCGYFVVLATNSREPIQYPSKELLDRVKAFLEMDADPTWRRADVFTVRLSVAFLSEIY
jgi:hypothetical protein